MNTGIQDAHNLAWKLALVLRGVVPEKWLDTYEIERRRVAEDIIAVTRSATQQTEMFTQLSPSDRMTLCKHMFVPESEKQRARRHAEELDLDYRSSPLCIESDGNFESWPACRFAGSRRCAACRRWRWVQLLRSAPRIPTSPVAFRWMQEDETVRRSRRSSPVRLRKSTNIGSMYLSFTIGCPKQVVGRYYRHRGSSVLLAPTIRCCGPLYVSDSSRWIHRVSQLPTRQSGYLSRECDVGGFKVKRPGPSGKIAIQNFNPQLIVIFTGTGIIKYPLLSQIHEMHVSLPVRAELSR